MAAARDRVGRHGMPPTRPARPRRVAHVAAHELGAAAYAIKAARAAAPDGEAESAGQTRVPLAARPAPGGDPRARPRRPAGAERHLLVGVRLLSTRRDASAPQHVGRHRAPERRRGGGHSGEPRPSAGRREHVRRCAGGSRQRGRAVKKFSTGPRGRQYWIFMRRFEGSLPASRRIGLAGGGAIEVTAPAGL